MSDQPQQLQSCRGKGGYVIHLKVFGTKTALCGYTPQGRTSANMKNRSGWWIFVRPTDATCKKCLAEAKTTKGI